MQHYLTSRIGHLFLLVVGIELLLVFLYATLVYLGDERPRFLIYFNLDGERTIPALFSSIQLMLVGLVFAWMNWLQRESQAVAQWFLVMGSLGFVFLGFDEAFAIHESITRQAQHVEWLPRFNGRFGIWVVPYLAVLVVLVTLSLGQVIRLYRLNPKAFWIMALGGLLFLMGAVGVEILGYHIREHPHLHGSYLITIAVEEFLEMFGITLILYGALRTTLELDAVPQHGKAAHIKMA